MQTSLSYKREKWISLDNSSKKIKIQEEINVEMSIQKKAQKERWGQQERKGNK